LLFLFTGQAIASPPFPPHPSQCLYKLPRSYTQPLMPAQASASWRFILLTRTVMSLWPPHTAAWRSADAQGMGHAGQGEGVRCSLGWR
jgi:hypothetical protein